MNKMSIITAPQKALDICSLSENGVCLLFQRLAFITFLLDSWLLFRVDRLFLYCIIFCILNIKNRYFCALFWLASITIWYSLFVLITNNLCQYLIFKNNVTIYKAKRLMTQLFYLCKVKQWSLSDIIIDTYDVV